MSDSKYSKKNPNKIQENLQFTKSSVFVKEDDQDWGSSGMNDIQQEDAE